MARFGGYRFSVRKKFNVFLMIMGIAELVLALFAGEKVINAVRNAINVNDTGAIFYTVYQMLGLTTGSTGGGLIGAIGIIGAVKVLFSWIQISRS